MAKTPGNDKPTGPQRPRRPAARKRGRSGGARRLVDSDARRQLHELQVHQVELEMQNKELREMRAEPDAALSRYTSLYESAPVGYLTLDRHGSVQQLNQAAAALLGGSRREWRKTRFDVFLAPGAWPVFSELLAAAAAEHGARSCEAEVQRPDGSAFFAQITVSYHAGSESYLVALMDGTARHDAFRRVRDAEQLAQKLLCQNRLLTRRMFETLEEDRRRVVHEIHDELGRGFFSVYEQIAAIMRTEYRLQPETRSNIRTIMANLAEMQNGLRRILLRLRPTLLDMAGIAECVREYVTQWKENQPAIQVDLKLEGDFDGVPDAINVTLFRVVQEALTNVAKHAHCGRVVVRMDHVGGQINLVVDDNGDGFDAGTLSLGVGLLGMRERVLALDGQFELTSQPERGTRIEVYLPASVADGHTGQRLDP